MITDHLKRALASGSIPPAYLFAGPPGAGKAQTARWLAQELIGSTREHHPDLLWVKPEKESLKIEQVRETLHRLSFEPFEAARVVVVLEQAEKMTLGAANALLKSLEEPPEFARFILTTTTPELLLATIRSRCQLVRFPPPQEAFLSRIKDHELYPKWHDELLPFLCRGGTLAGAASSAPTFLEISKKAEEWAGSPLPEILAWLAAWWHDLAVCCEVGSAAPVQFTDDIAALQPEAERRGFDRIVQDIDLIDETKRALESHVNKTLALERLFMGLAFQG